MRALALSVRLFMLFGVLALAMVGQSLLSYRISETIKENIKEYYRAFKDCNDPHNLGDLTPFLLMMLRMILAALTELSGSLSRRLKSWGATAPPTPLPQSMAIFMGRASFTSPRIRSR